jgi:hypothetical protein
MSKKGSLSHSLQAVARGKERPIAAEHNPSGRSQDAKWVAINFAIVPRAVTMLV